MPEAYPSAEDKDSNKYVHCSRQDDKQLFGTVYNNHVIYYLNNNFMLLFSIYYKGNKLISQHSQYYYV